MRKWRCINEFKKNQCPALGIVLFCFLGHITQKLDEKALIGAKVGPRRDIRRPFYQVFSVVHVTPIFDMIKHRLNYNWPILWNDLTFI